MNLMLAKAYLHFVKKLGKPYACNFAPYDSAGEVRGLCHWTIACRSRNIFICLNTNGYAIFKVSGEFGQSFIPDLKKINKENFASIFMPYFENPIAFADSLAIKFGSGE